MDTHVLTPHFQEPDVATIRLRFDGLDKFRRVAAKHNPAIGIDATFAKQIGINAGQLSRVLSGKSAPGTRFIAGCLDLFGIECFGDLFSVEPDDAGAAA